MNPTSPNVALPPYTLRRIAREEVLWIADIESMVQPTPWSLAIIELSLMTDEHFYVAACEHEKDWASNGNPLMGFLIANRLPPTADITNFGVHPRWQGRGVGQALLHHFFTRMQQQSVEELRLEVRVSNPRAFNLYQKNGFVTTARRKNYYDLPERQGKEDGLLMTKWL